MVKKINIVYYAVSLLLIIALAAASFFSQDLYHSLFFIILYAVYALTLLLAAVFLPGAFRKALHVLLALLIFAVIAEKTFNERQLLPMGEGGSYFLHIDGDTLELELTDFIITRDLSNAVDYESRLVIDKKDTFSVRVNNPYSYKHVRFYQSAYRSLTPFYFCMEDTLKLFEGQTDTLKGVPLTFLEYDPVLERAAIRYNKVLFYLPVEREYQFLDKELYIYTGESETGTVLEYVEVRGHKILLLIVLLMILLLFYRTIKRK